MLRHRVAPRGGGENTEFPWYASSPLTSKKVAKTGQVVLQVSWPGALCPHQATAALTRPRARQVTGRKGMSCPTGGERCDARCSNATADPLARSNLRRRRLHPAPTPPSFAARRTPFFLHRIFRPYVMYPHFTSGLLRAWLWWREGLGLRGSSGATGVGCRCPGEGLWQGSASPSFHDFEDFWCFGFWQHLMGIQI